MRDRAFRRHQEFKHKRLAKERLANAWNWTPPEPPEEPDAKTVGILAKTPHVCSDYCCGNPRHHFAGDGKLTMQERKQNEKDQFSD